MDTNVLVHASTPSTNQHAESRKFAEALLASEASICVDAGFDWNEAQNRSLIGHEYLEKFRYGMIAYSLVVALVAQGRVKVVGSSTDAPAAKKINQVLSNRRDRTFVKVAVNSDERVLVSHDFADFPPKKRRELLTRVAVRIVDAAAATELIGDQAPAAANMGQEPTTAGDDAPRSLDEVAPAASSPEASTVGPE